MTKEDRDKFEEWMIQVDSEVIGMSGCSVHDLPDQCYGDWWEDGCSPKEAAIEALEYAGF